MHVLQVSFVKNQKENGLTIFKITPKNLTISLISQFGILSTKLFLIDQLKVKTPK